MIRDATGKDAEAICAIYNPYIADSTITFEVEPVSTEAMRERIADVCAKYPWLVFEQQNRIAGYAYATAWRPRAAYRHTVESTVYLAPDFVRQGMGKSLYQELIKRLRGLAVHRVIGGIALPNAASVALHEGLGFKKVAHFGEVGRKFDRWIDVGYWELPLEGP